MLLAACGGGGGGGSAPITFQSSTFGAKLTTQGTLLTCTTAPAASFTVSGADHRVTMDCPGRAMVAGAFTAESWSWAQGGQAVGSAAPVVPAPVVLLDGGRYVVLGAAYAPLQGLSPTLQALADDGSVIASFPAPATVPVSSFTGAPPARWQWTIAQSGGQALVSEALPTRSFAGKDLGYWGAMTHPLLTDASLPPAADVNALLRAVLPERDVEVAHLDVRGEAQVGASLLGACADLGIRRNAGGYDVTAVPGAGSGCAETAATTLVIEDEDDDDGDRLFEMFLPPSQSIAWSRTRAGAAAGDASHDAAPLGSPYDDWGLGSLLDPSRVFRDVRVVDLDGDGRMDVISNVYGLGCTIIGMQRADGGYDFSTPLRRDGSCLSGNGETILLADFDGDGLVDIFLPFYQRYDLLKNLGHGQFVDIADDRGIAFPTHLPQPEGAAAVDLDLDGAIDIVVSDLVLMNDGTGHFTARSPFGANTLIDEGMSVADLDGDGIFDIVKNNPYYGPRVYWGRSDRTSFDASNWVLGGEPVLTLSYGLVAGRLTGAPYPDFVFAGGLPSGSPPQVCAMMQTRTYACMASLIATGPGDWNDLMMIDDMDGSGRRQLIGRFAHLHQFTSNEDVGTPWRVTLLDASGMATQYGRTVRARCAGDDSLVGVKFVDGGNNYMAQSAYAVSFDADWCPAILVDVATRRGIVTSGPFAPGDVEIRLPS